MNRFVLMAVLIAAAAVLLLSFAASGEFYQYEDENGSVNFTDDPASIPKKMKARKKVRKDSIGDPNGPVMAVNISRNQVLVPVTVSYRGREEQAIFILDTGASSSTISPELQQGSDSMPKMETQPWRRWLAAGSIGSATQRSNM
jgi:hypothetical protein